MAKREPETLWKLVDARCSQLADSVSGARVAFLVALSWSFIWAWSLYSVDLGYLNQLSEGKRLLYTQSLAEAASDNLKVWCSRNLRPPASDEKPDSQPRLTACRQLIKIHFEWTEKAWLDSTMLALPGGLGKLFISDLGVIGEFGLLVILLWFFFAARRENHAVRAIVDMDRHSRDRADWFSHVFVLESKDRYLSAEHVAYAYHSVAQRFVFIFSHHSRPLLAVTILLVSLPALVAFWNLATDIRDLVRQLSDPAHGLLLLRTAVEAALFVFVLLTTIRIVRAELDTSVLLNGWFLASRDVWMDQWDEETHEPATPATIDVHQQKAFPVIASAATA